MNHAWPWSLGRLSRNDGLLPTPENPEPSFQLGLSRFGKPVVSMAIARFLILLF